MSIEIQCMTEMLIVITIKFDYSKVPSKSTVLTYDYDTKKASLMIGSGCSCMITSVAYVY